MARIRTIKPDFFTSEDIVSLTPLARLLYIGIWCEADKEGRLVWKPYTFKLRYLPGDACDIKALCQEIVDQGLVVLYGDGYAVIPAFSRHQHLNPRESESVIPAPDACESVTTTNPRVIDACARVPHASARVPHAQGGREGKGKERNGGECASASAREAAAPPSASPPPPEPADAGPPPPFLPEYREVIADKRPDLLPTAVMVWLLFCEQYPQQKRGMARWTKWVINEKPAGQGVPAGSSAGAVPSVADPDSRASVEAVGMARGLGRWEQLAEPWAAYKARVKNQSAEAEKC